MEKRDDLKSVLPYLPLLVRSSTLFWPSKVVDALKSMAKGPEHSRVNSGEVLSVAICDIRISLSLFEPLAPFALNGYALFFDDVILYLLKKAYISGRINKVVWRGCSGTSKFSVAVAPSIRKPLSKCR